MPKRKLPRQTAVFFSLIVLFSLNARPAPAWDPIIAALEDELIQVSYKLEQNEKQLADLGSSYQSAQSTYNFLKSDLKKNSAQKDKAWAALQALRDMQKEYPDLSDEKAYANFIKAKNSFATANSALTDARSELNRLSIKTEEAQAEQARLLKLEARLARDIRSRKDKELNRLLSQERSYTETATEPCRSKDYPSACDQAILNGKKAYLAEINAILAQMELPSASELGIKPVMLASKEIKSALGPGLKICSCTVLTRWYSPLVSQQVTRLSKRLKSSSPPFSDKTPLQPAPEFYADKSDDVWELPEVFPPVSSPKGKLISLSETALGETNSKACALALSNIAKKVFKGRKPDDATFKKCVYRMYCNPQGSLPNGMIRVEVIVDFYKLEVANAPR